METYGIIKKKDVIYNFYALAQALQQPSDSPRRKGEKIT